MIPNIVMVLFLVCIQSLGKALAQKGFTLTVYGMPQKTWMIRESEGNHAATIAQYYGPAETREIQLKHSYNFAFGILFKHSISKRFSLGYSIQHAPLEQRYSTYIYDRNEHLNFGIFLKYIKTSALLQYNLLAREKFQLFLLTGPQLSMLIAENGGIPVYGSNSKIPIFELVDPGGAYHNFVIGSTLSLGAEIKMDSKTSIICGPYVDGNITSLQKKNFQESIYGMKVFQEPNVTIRASHAITCGINVGLLFKIR